MGTTVADPHEAQVETRVTWVKPSWGLESPGLGEGQVGIRVTRSSEAQVGTTVAGSG